MFLCVGVKRCLPGAERALNDLITRDNNRLTEATPKAADGELIARETTTPGAGDGYGEGGSTEDSDSKEGKIGSEFHNALDLCEIRKGSEEDCSKDRPKKL